MRAKVAFRVGKSLIWFSVAVGMAFYTIALLIQLISTGFEIVGFIQLGIVVIVGLTAGLLSSSNLEYAEVYESDGKPSGPDHQPNELNAAQKS